MGQPPGNAERRWWRLSAGERRFGGGLLALLLLGSAYVVGAKRQQAALLRPPFVRVLEIDESLEQQTTVAPSLIPGAGDGLFAATTIRRGTAIGHLGGRLLAHEDVPPDRSFIAVLPECAWRETAPAMYLDASRWAGKVHKINFAPAAINGQATGFQNAELEHRCEPPYVLFIATQDIAPGQEIYTSYGPTYRYDRFMYLPPVQAFFCARAGIDCRNGFTFDADLASQSR